MEKEPFDDGHDWIVKDKETGQRLALFHDQNKVLPFAYRRGRKTVTIEKVKREGTNKMNEHRIVNLSEMMLKVVSEDVILPKTGDPEKEAAELTKDTGKYHYADYDDMINKPVIINTNVEAQDQDEWMQKAYNTPVNEETPVIEPSNFEKNDEYEVTVSDQVAESDNDSDWKEVGIGLFKHNFLPLAYDDNSGQAVLYDVDGASNLDDAETVGVFDSVDQMKSWIADNIKEDVVEEYRKIAEGGNGSSTTSEITTSDNGVEGDDGDNYGPAPTDDQNDIEFDQDGKFVIEDESYIYQPGPDDQLKIVFYQTNPNNSNDDDLFIGDTVLKSPEDLESEFPREKYGNYKFVPLAQDGRRFDDEEHFTFTYDDIMKDLAEFGSNSPNVNESNPYADDDDERRERRAENKKRDDEIEYSKHLDEYSNDGGDDYEWYGPYETKEVAKANAIGAISGGMGEEPIEGYNYSIKMKPEGFYWSEYAPGLANEGKDYRYDPDADEGDWDRQERFKQRKHNKNARRKEIDEAYDRDAWEAGYEAFENGQPCPTDPSGKDGWMEAKKEHRKSGQMDESTLTETDIERAFILSVDFTPERIEIEHKGMTDVESALFLMADGRPVDKFRNELNMGGLPMVAELERDNALTVIVLASTARDAIDAILELDVVHRVLYEFEIDDRSFIGLLTGGKAGSSMDLTGELTEDEEFFEAPDFVVSSENLYANELAEDPMFIQVMNDAYLTIAEKQGEKIEEFNPSIDDVDQIIETGIDSYPNGHKYSFMMSDPMARDAINDAFNILWDEGKIGSDHVA